MRFPVRLAYRCYIVGTNRFLFRRPLRIVSGPPLISFTFDDFPRSALQTGGTILKQRNVRGTYYAAFGLMGKEAPTGEMFVEDDVKRLLEEGHELGCHTYGHISPITTETASFEASILKNREVLNSLLPGASLKTFSYPFGFPRPGIKHKTGPHFLCCRGGGQIFNSGIADLNHLGAYFLEFSRESPKRVKDIIDKNTSARGWLIFATHDVCPTPTRFGCTPEFFSEIVEYAIRSGSHVLPVVQAVQTLRDRIKQASR